MTAARTNPPVLPPACKALREIPDEGHATDIDFDTFCKSDMRVVKVRDCVAVKKSKKLLQFTLDHGSGTDRTILSGMHSYYEPEELVGKTLVAIVNIPPRAMMGIVSHGMFLSAECKKGKMRL